MADVTICCGINNRPEFFVYFSVQGRPNEDDIINVFEESIKICCGVVSIISPRLDIPGKLQIFWIARRCNDIESFVQQGLDRITAGISSCCGD